MNHIDELNFRHELKYYIRYSDRDLLKYRFAGLLQRDRNVDANGEYKIRSLYFDDYWNSAYETKLMGTQKRYKYRIRIYNDSDTVINLERKLKYDNYIAKEKAALTRNEVYSILEGRYTFLRDSPQPLCREFYYECIAKVLRPQVIVDYEREPFVFYPGDIRITFDRCIRAGNASFDIFDKNLPTMETLQPGYLVMEVKFSDFLPKLIKKALPTDASDCTSVSKYVLCCDKRMDLYGIL
jgi:hypothetical protein